MATSPSSAINSTSEGLLSIVSSPTYNQEYIANFVNTGVISNAMLNPYITTTHNNNPSFNSFQAPKKVLDVDKIVVGSKDGEILPLMKELFNPVIKECLPKFSDRIKVCKRDKFTKKFKLDNSFLKLYDDLLDSGVNCILAGGKLIDFFNNEKESTGDWDLWFISEKEYFNAEDYFRKIGFTIISKGHLTECHKGDIKVQLINKFFSSAEEVITTFDIRCCSIACDKNYFYWCFKTLNDIKNKKIILRNLKVNQVILMRVIKYVKKGYEILMPDLTLAAISYLASFPTEITPQSRRLYDRAAIGTCDYTSFLEEEPIPF